MKYHALFYFFCTICLFSCGKTEFDFVGKYKTYYGTKIEVANSLTGMAFGRKPIVTAKVYKDLGMITLVIFPDQKSENIVGEASIVFKTAQNMSFTPREESNKVDFDLTNIRMNGDTLEFNMENAITKMSGKKIKGQLVKSEDGSVIGISQELGLQEIVKHNPFFIVSENSLDYYGVYNEKKTSEMYITFYKLQESDLLSRASTEANEVNKAIAANSLKVIQARLTE